MLTHDRQAHPTANLTKNKKDVHRDRADKIVTYYSAQSLRH
jgi:hypothetical protein